MGSPGVFIHSGTLGGRLSEPSLAASASLPLRAPAITATLTNALLPRRNRRREGSAVFLSILIGSVIARPPSKSRAYKRLDANAVLTFNLMVPTDGRT